MSDLGLMTSRKAVENLIKLPPLAYMEVAGCEWVCIIKRNELGYSVTDWKLPESKQARTKMITSLNRKLKVTKAQASAMYFGSVYGWHVPAANPDNECNTWKR